MWLHSRPRRVVKVVGGCVRHLQEVFGISYSDRQVIDCLFKQVYRLSQPRRLAARSPYRLVRCEFFILTVNQK